MDKDTIYELLGEVEGKQLHDELLVQNGAINVSCFHVQVRSPDSSYQS